MMAKITHPKIRLIVDPKVDTNLGPNFISNIMKGQSNGFPKKFLPHTLHYLLNKKISDKKRSKLIAGYAQYMYKSHLPEMISGVKAANADWKKVEKKYFTLVDRLFNKHPWPKGKYIGYSTVWHSYLRNVASKTFYFPYRHGLPGYSNFVAAHELMHLMFFDYIHAKYDLNEKDVVLGKESNYIWKVSEAFNNVIEEWPPYKKIFIHGARTHQGVEEIFKKMNKQWQKRQDVDWLLDKWFK